MNHLPGHRDDFARALCDHLAERDRYRLGFLRTDLLPGDIIDIDVRWDTGERYDPTFPRDNEPPVFEMSVTFRPRTDLDSIGLNRTGSLAKPVDPGFLLELLLRQSLNLPWSRS